MKKVIVIPVRLSSSRLPRKVLLDLGGKSVLERVYDQCAKVKYVEVYIATDSVEIKDVCSSFTENVIMTDSKHESGTDRIVEAITNLQCDIVVNVQVDEPFVDPSLITNLFDELEKDENLNMSSVMEKINNLGDLENPNVVKVVVNKYNDALYFSRSVIPYVRSRVNREVIEKNQFYKHAGVYGYKRNFYSIIQKWKEVL